MNRLAEKSAGVSRETAVGAPSAPMGAPPGAPRKRLVLLFISSFGEEGEGINRVVGGGKSIELVGGHVPRPNRPKYPRAGAVVVRFCGAELHHTRGGCG